MNNLLYFVLLFCCAWPLIFQPTLALRIKRADQANATDHLKQNTAKAVANTLNVAPAAAGDKPEVQLTNLTQAAVVKAAAAAASVSASAATLAKSKPELLEDALNLDSLGRLHHAKRRMALIDDSLLPHMGRRARQHAGNAAPPYVYFNKMISPDGKQELKEFQLLSPNVVIESVQHDVNYGPGQELGGVLLLNAESNSNAHKPTSIKHHQKHKAAALPPFLYLLQQMLQPNLNLDMDAPNQRNRMDMPLYQFLDNAVDNALHSNNRESIEHLLAEHEQRDNELNDNKDTNKDKELTPAELQKLEDTKEDKLKEANELITNRKDDELVVSCPIHHEHHANNNGDFVDDDVVLVNECHIV